ncbi:NUDIX domain-containing protein [Blastococcus xanthinilyticus]|uniref:Putative NUDIX family NTP pyrophosphohydrolase n=1 Tax=Blastococcus xanthinilyticus TaxID=1564164 RepID=A0A5S5D6V1_9ACTN|nr:NUDIX domain-containing protein [Blastococcus xanthinilyticus]TYP90776.1 putative NUDIX family NTP pyrophosphohydrolase [Blastococcus xanthinilyticus]
MPPVRSSGVLLYRFADGEPQVLLGHMGGPFWARKDDGAWTVPKGEHDPDEDGEAAARREFAEELGCPVPAATLHPLGEVRGRKLLAVWAAEGDLDADAITSNTFALEWPPRSGRVQEFPEIDRAAWFDVGTARTKLVKAQLPFLDRLAAHLAG